MDLEMEKKPSESSGQLKLQTFQIYDRRINNSEI